MILPTLFAAARAIGLPRAVNAFAANSAAENAVAGIRVAVNGTFRNGS